MSVMGLLLAVVPAASATSLSGLPTIGCYRTANGGTIAGSKLVVNDDGGMTTYAAYVYRWNGSWAEVGPMYTSDGQWLQYFQDSAYGSLSEQPVSLTVPHGYYRVMYYFETTGDSGVQHAYGEVTTSSTEYDVYTCLL
jgi:hypothetical protein